MNNLKFNEISKDELILINGGKGLEGFLTWIEVFNQAAKFGKSASKGFDRNFNKNFDKLFKK